MRHWTRITAPVGRPGQTTRADSHLHEAATPHSVTETVLEQSHWQRIAQSKAAWIGLPILGGAALLQAVIALATGSLSLAADALHTVGDLLPGVLAIVGARLAMVRFDTLTVRLIGATILLSGVFIGFEALVAGHVLFGNPLWVMAGGAVGLAANLAWAWLNRSFGHGTGKAAFTHAVSDAAGSAAVILAGVTALVGFPAVGQRVADVIAAVIEVGWPLDQPRGPPHSGRVGPYLGQGPSGYRRPSAGPRAGPRAGPPAGPRAGPRSAGPYPGMRRPGTHRPTRRLGDATPAVARDHHRPARAGLASRRKPLSRARGPPPLRGVSSSQ